ncbi:MAG TPA: SDR family oxidoreductase [Ramlibacter sp.]|nr:SDR family oxidoreductase [Ramlibacter sp.]
MELGIAGRRALVCASSSGLGLACAAALAREGCSVWINGRDRGRLEQARARIAAEGGEVRAVAADLVTAQGREALLAACPQPDILVTNNAGPPPGELGDWDHGAWIAALEANLLAPLLLVRAVLPGMRERRFGRIVNITSAMVKSPRPAMALSTTARTGLTAFCKAMSFEAAADNVTLNNLLPERIDTPRQQQMAQRMVQREGIELEEARRRIALTIAARRMGRPEEFGDACAYLCSAQAGFISGQNLQLDGGSYPGLT